MAVLLPVTADKGLLKANILRLWVDLRCQLGQYYFNGYWQVAVVSLLIHETL